MRPYTYSAQKSAWHTVSAQKVGADGIISTLKMKNPVTERLQNLPKVTDGRYERGSFSFQSLNSCHTRCLLHVFRINIMLWSLF